jgi:hypothetical protein
MLRVNAMDNLIHDRKDEENFPMCEISDDALETAAGNKKADTFTQWMCTALYFCPGPLPA